MEKVLQRALQKAVGDILHLLKITLNSNLYTLSRHFKTSSRKIGFC